MAKSETVKQSVYLPAKANKAGKIAAARYDTSMNQLLIRGLELAIEEKQKGAKIKA